MDVSSNEKKVIRYCKISTPPSHDTTVTRTPTQPLPKALMRPLLLRHDTTTASCNDDRILTIWFAWPRDRVPPAQRGPIELPPSIRDKHRRRHTIAQCTRRVRHDGRHHPAKRLTRTRSRGLWRVVEAIHIFSLLLRLAAVQKWADRAIRGKVYDRDEDLRRWGLRFRIFEDG